MENLSAQLVTAKAKPSMLVTAINSSSTAPRDRKRAKIARVCALVIAALVGFSGTDFGPRAFSQLGISNLFAQTLKETDRALQNTSNALKSFIGRSPGARGKTDLLKGKVKRAALPRQQSPESAKPMQRALGKVFVKPENGLIDALLDQPDGVFLPVENVGTGGPGVDLPPVVLGPGNFSSISTGGFGGGGSIIGGGGTAAGNPPAVPAPPPAVINAVPEPSTWILLLLGFGAIGASIRRAKGKLPSISGLTGHCAKN